MTASIMTSAVSPWDFLHASSNNLSHAIDSLTACSRVKPQRTQILAT